MSPLFYWPVGTEIERAQLDKLPGAWITATQHGARYNATGKWARHPGLDLNLNVPQFDADAHAPVYAAADGRVMFAGHLPVWGMVIVIEHDDPDRLAPIWTRYAHVEAVIVKPGELILRSEPIARVGNADNRYPYHLHYDMARVDLGRHPSDWPGDDLDRLQRDYFDPLEVMRAQAERLRTSVIAWQVTARPSLRVRALPQMYTLVIGHLPYGTIVPQGEFSGEWMRIDVASGDQPLQGWVHRGFLREVQL